MEIEGIVWIVLLIACYQRAVGGTLRRNLVFLTPLACIGPARMVLAADHPVGSSLLWIAVFAAAFVLSALLGDAVLRRLELQ
jgi:hypothetical protein